MEQTVEMNELQYYEDNIRNKDLYRPRSNPLVVKLYEEGIITDEMITPIYNMLEYINTVMGTPASVKNRDKHQDIVELQNNIIAMARDVRHLKKVFFPLLEITQYYIHTHPLPSGKLIDSDLVQSYFVFFMMGYSLMIFNKYDFKITKFYHFLDAFEVLGKNISQANLFLSEEQLRRKCNFGPSYYPNKIFKYLINKPRGERRRANAGEIHRRLHESRQN